MAATETQLVGGSFQDALGNPLAFGYLIFHLSQDCLVSGVGTICAGIDIKILLDANGNVASATSPTPAPDQFVWSNLVMTPQNNFYRVTGFTAEGQRAFGPNNQQVAAGSVFNLDSWIPNTVISWFPTLPSFLTLEINGALASSQSLQNLENSATVTVVDNGGGNISFSAGSGTEFEVNGTPLSSSSTVNYESGTGISVTNPSAGNVLITNTSTGTAFDTPGNNFFFGAGIPSLYGLQEGNPSFANGGVVANNVYVFAFNLDVTWVLTTISYISQNSAGGAYYGFGIYSSSGNLLVQSSFLSGAIAGTVGTNVFSPVTLPPGMYYFAYSVDNAAFAAPSIQNPLTDTVTLTQLYQLCNSNSQFTSAVATNTMGVGTGIMPSTLGALTGFTTANIPMATPKWTP